MYYNFYTLRGNYMIKTCPSLAQSDPLTEKCTLWHDDVIKWKHFPRNWPFVRGIHRSPVSSPHKGQWRTTLMFSLICAWINGRVNYREAGDLRPYLAHYGVTVMLKFSVRGILWGWDLTVGSGHLLWWNRISFLVQNSHHQAFCLQLNKDWKPLVKRVSKINMKYLYCDR